jgi:large subunit ribosomal protein L19
MSIHPVMQRLADKLKRTDLPEFVPGDQVRVQVKIKEGDKERLQAFEGLVIAINKGPQGTFTVRKMSFGQGVERIFPFNSKVVDKIEKIRSYKVRRAKLFYLRESARQGSPPEGSGPRGGQGLAVPFAGGFVYRYPTTPALAGVVFYSG